MSEKCAFHFACRIVRVDSHSIQSNFQFYGILHNHSKTCKSQYENDCEMNEDGNRKMLIKHEGFIAVQLCNGNVQCA